MVRDEAWEKVFIQSKPYHAMRKFSDEELLDLHRKGLTDREISEKLGVTQAAVNYRREKLGLENNYQSTTFSDQQLLTLYNQGLNDREVSEALGVTQAAVNYRRGRLGLKSNYIPESAFSTLYEKGLSGEDIADSLNAPLPAVLHMMKRLEVVSEHGAAEAEV
jgi:predicted transcriptional regulator